MDESATSENVNPACTTDAELPDPPENGELGDPAEPHPDEPGAPPDAPPRRVLTDGDQTAATVRDGTDRK